MKTKIIGFIVCTLLIITVIPAGNSLNNNEIYSSPQRNPQPIPRGIWDEIQKLLPSDGATDDMFGYSVSVDGDTTLIGVPYDDDNGVSSGSVYVFTRNGTTWTQQAKLLASDGSWQDRFGESVSLDGDTALIGAYSDDDGSGSAYVFTRTGTTWAQEVKLLPLDGAPVDLFGYSVSLDGDTALIGAYWDDDNEVDSGSVYVFIRAGNTWIQHAKLVASDAAAEDYFGYSVSLDGGTALIGAFEDDDNGNSSGSAYIFTRTGTNWTQQAKLLPLDGAQADFFGYSVSLERDTALIGAKQDDDNGQTSGSAYVFIRTGTIWAQQGKLLASDGAGGDKFGVSVSLDVDVALIGASYDGDNGVGSGSAYVFVRTDTAWAQQAKFLASDGAEDDCFGCSVSLDGNTALIGEYWDDDNGNDSGSVYVFKGPNQIQKKAMVFGMFKNMVTEGDYITIEAVNLRMILFKPFQFLHYISNEEIIFSNDYIGIMTKHFVIGLYDITY